MVVVAGPSNRAPPRGQEAIVAARRTGTAARCGWWTEISGLQKTQGGVTACCDSKGATDSSRSRTQPGWQRQCAAVAWAAARRRRRRGGDWALGLKGPHTCSARVLPGGVERRCVPPVPGGWNGAGARRGRDARSIRGVAPENAPSRRRRRRAAASCRRR